MDCVRNLADLRLADAEAAGGKGANLGELIAAGFPVPDGFVITRVGYFSALEAAGVRAEIADEHAKALTNVDDAAALAETCERLRALVRSAGLTAELAASVGEAYRALGGQATVAVRSSATGEDGAEASFAGMNASFTNVVDERSLLRRVVDCWASLFSPRVVSYRASRGYAGEPAIAVVVQRMVLADRAGVIFTADPRTAGRDQVVIEAVVGQGEAIVSGAVEPDTYVVAKQDLRVLSARVGTQSLKVIAEVGGGDVTVPLTAQAGGRRVLDDATVLELARLAARVEDHYGVPQDVEFAIEDHRTWLVQSRPITTLPPDREPEAGALVTGLAASPGAASGAVRVLRDPAEAVRLREGEVLVAPMTNPDWVPAIRRAAGLVTDGGGMTCHAAVVARELGVPCVVGTGDATRVLADRTLVTVDGSKGEVRAGAVVHEPARATPVVAPAAAETIGTRLYVNLAMPEHAEEVAAQAVDGVGLLRAEFLLTEALGGRHPRDLLARGEEEAFVTAMADSL
ncbi:PEP/pyruvate-binding domain-containing protein, partial [Amycolatopsis sp. NPDC051903]|uniref:PEP/pyruvate-binding domain-containing protein n=1 Tax=Amycolatopsis sp. NPDC051903 TaxID=3363936 RepID=UPI003794D1BF